jgi:hypothetical protein
MTDLPAVPCPFVYSTGRRCCGAVYRASAYGPTKGRHYVLREDVRKYRLWCSDKNDHAGAVNSRSKRMEFYPDELAVGVEDILWQGDLLS